MKMERNVKKKASRIKNISDGKNTSSRFLILHNDDVNTFDFVIESLIDICNHDAVQAEQCAYITHHRGKCDIKKGTYSVLDMMRKALLDRGLKVTID